MIYYINLEKAIYKSEKRCDYTFYFSFSQEFENEEHRRFRLERDCKAMLGRVHRKLQKMCNYRDWKNIILIKLSNKIWDTKNGIQFINGFQKKEKNKRKKDGKD